VRELTFGLSPVIRLGLRNPAKKERKGYAFQFFFNTNEGGRASNHRG